MSAKRLNIWHVSEHPGFFGGIEQNLFALAEGMRARGHRQILVCRDGEATDERYLSPFDGIQAIRCGADLEAPARRERPDVIVIQRPFGRHLLQSSLSIAPVVRVVHDHDLVCPRRHKYFPVSKKICRHAAGTACWLHGCVIGRDAKGGFAFNSVRERLADIARHRFARRIVVASTYMRDELIANGLPGGRISVLAPLPGDIEIEVEPFPEESAAILFVGQLVRGKGVDLLLRALARIRRPWRLVIAGDGNMRPDLERLSRRLGLARRTIFLGRLNHEETLRLYGRALIVAVPSRWPEPFGMIGIEAMAAARPLVAFSVGGIRDWLWHGVNGLGAPEGDLSAMADNIEWLLSDRKLAGDLGQNGRRLFENKYRFADYLLHFERLLAEVTEDR